MPRARRNRHDLDLATLVRTLRREACALEAILEELRSPLHSLATLAAARLPELQAGQRPDPLLLLLPVVHRATLGIEEVFAELEDRADVKELRRHARQAPAGPLVQAVRAILAELEARRSD